MREHRTCRHPLFAITAFKAFCCDFPLIHPWSSKCSWFNTFTERFHCCSSKFCFGLVQCPLDCLGKLFPQEQQLVSFPGPPLPIVLVPGIITQLTSNVSSHNDIHLSQSTGSEADMQRSDNKALLNIQFCVHNTVKICVYWICQVKHGSYQPEEYPSHFRVKDSWVNATP